MTPGSHPLTNCPVSGAGARALQQDTDRVLNLFFLNHVFEYLFIYNNVCVFNVCYCSEMFLILEIKFSQVTSN